MQVDVIKSTGEQDTKQRFPEDGWTQISDVLHRRYGFLVDRFDGLYHSILTAALLSSSPVYSSNPPFLTDSLAAALAKWADQEQLPSLDLASLDKRLAQGPHASRTAVLNGTSVSHRCWIEAKAQSLWIHVTWDPAGTDGAYGDVLRQLQAQMDAYASTATAGTSESVGSFVSSSTSSSSSSTTGPTVLTAALAYKPRLTIRPPPTPHGADMFTTMLSPTRTVATTTPYAPFVSPYSPTPPYSPSPSSMFGSLSSFSTSYASSVSLAISSYSSSSSAAARFVKPTMFTMPLAAAKPAMPVLLQPMPDGPLPAHVLPAAPRARSTQLGPLPFVVASAATATSFVDKHS
jgi:hypothetical protein